MKARVHSFETFGSVDGPGVRFVVFMQGCKMRCKYCHNPDSWKIEDGQEFTAQEILDKALRYKSYWGKDGGITVSGGEPLLQIDFLIEFFKLCKEHNIHTNIDSCGAPFSMDKEYLEKFDTLLKYTDLIMLDIKHIDNHEHLELTKRENTNILQMAKYLSDKNVPVWIRHVLVPTITDNDVYLQKLADFLATLHNIKKVEVLPYHSFGAYKWEQLGLHYELKDICTPSEDRIANAKKILKVDQYN